jgi:hypothetical protein
MKNNAYLIRTSKNESEALFEAINTIPFFWFALMNTRVIKKLGEEVLRLFRRSKTKILSNSNTNIRIPKDFFLKKLCQRKVCGNTLDRMSGNLGFLVVTGRKLGGELLQIGTGLKFAKQSDI